MTRSTRETLPEIRMTPAGARTWPGALWLSTLLLAWVVVATLGSGRILAQGEVPRGVISAVKITGNNSIGEDEIRRKLKSRPGRDLDVAMVEGDLKELLDTKWFSDVKTSYSRDPDQQGSYILTFTVREAPVLRAVEFQGRNKVKLKDIEEATGLKVGTRADHLRNMLAVNQIKRLYEEKGFLLAEVKLLDGSKAGDTKAIFEIFEGPKCKVTGITFTGNTIVSDARMRTQVGSHAAILGFGGTFHREDLEDDARKLREYYQGMGYFEVKVSPLVKPSSKIGEVVIEFAISEGVQYKVRNIEFKGNELLPTDTLKQGLVMHSGQPFNDLFRDADRKKLEDQYGEIGCIDAFIEIERRYADPIEQPGVIDLVYNIQEGEPYLLGHLIVRGNERTRDRVLRREAEMAGLVPGEPINAKRIDLYRKRLENLQYFVAQPEQGKPIEIKLVNRRPPDQPYGELPKLDIEEVVRTRLQDPGEGFPDGPMIIQEQPLAPGPGPAGAIPMNSGVFDPLPNQVPSPLPPNVAPGAGGGRVVAPPFTGDLPPLPVGDGEPPGTFPSQPGQNQNNVGPDRNDPFPNRSYADIVTNVEEGPTGRIMFGFGATSYGGLNGNFILHESNFDIAAIPKSWRELTNGQAFRGAGQDFRIELSPGTLVNRALVSFRDPYFLNLPGGYAMGLGLSGYAFSRFYNGQYNEYRAGGRFSLGSQFGTSTYADLALRVEDVRVSDFYFPAPASFLAVDGHTFLTSLRPSIRFDNRNDPFAPNKGQYLEAAFEQGWGDFTFPKFPMEGRKYFTLGSRPDGSGKRILTMRGYFGVSGQDTPLYERFYAGDFRSMRGFTYRGVGPFELGRNVGGILSTIGSVEYQFPWTANDKLQQVVFCDFGTVESDYRFTTFRASVGTGLRIYLPQQVFGPLPLAFDFAFPIAMGPDDRDQLFTFFIGAFW